MIELLDEIDKNPYDATEIKIPKIKKYFASKACRMSIMIGDHLSNNDMKEIFKKLSNLKSPWNCPHGRPTLISLGDIKAKVRQLQPKKIRKCVDPRKLSLLEFDTA